MGTTSSVFTGSSQFSTDFQNVVTRAVNIANLPVSLMQTQLSSLQDQSSAISGIDSRFAALQTALNSVQDAMSGAAFNLSVSDTKQVSASVANGVVEGSYKIEVVNAGSPSTSLTKSAWVNTAGAAKTYDLWVGAASNPDNKISITPTDNSAQSVAAAINARAGDKVRAIAMNVGSSSDPDWRISLQTVALDNTPVDIADNGTSLQNQTAGQQAQYKIGDSGKLVSSTLATVNIATGLTVKLLSANAGNPVTITVSRSTYSLSNALSKFADAYNSVVTELDNQRGSGSGKLKGDSIVYSLSQALSSMATYSPSGSSFSGLRDIGLELSSDGQLTFDASKFSTADGANPLGIAAFLGSATDGGFLKAATDALSSVENADTGILKTTKSIVDKQITDLGTEITAKQADVDQLQKNLLSQMAAADAAIAAMEQQYSFITGMFEAQKTASSQYA